MAQKKVKEEKLPATSEGAKDSTLTEMDAGAELAKSEQQSDIYYAVLTAKKFPRDEQKARDELLTACDIEQFAVGAYYAFPRGRKFDEASGTWKPNIVTGASIRLAREAVRVFENIRTGFLIIQDDPDKRTIVAYAWDCQKNIRESSADTFEKLVQKKQKDGQTLWMVADERELRELTFRRASILKRNCILSLLPSYFVDKLVDVCKRTAAGGAKTDLKDAILTMQRSFAEIGISAKGLEQYLGKPLKACTRDNLSELRGIFQSIRDGMLSKEEQQEFFGAVAEKGEAKETAESQREPLSTDKLRAHDNQEPPTRAAAKKAAKTTQKTNGEEQTLTARETALQLIEDATADNFSEIKSQVIGLCGHIKNDKELSEVTIKLSTKQKQLARK